MNQIFNIGSDGLCLIDFNYTILRVNEAFLNLSGKNNFKAIGKKCFDVFPSINCSTENCPVNRIRAGEEKIEYEIVRINSQGKKVHCITSVSAFRDAKGDIIGVLESLRDITEYKKAKEKINFMAYHDALTGLPNRYQFSEYLNENLKKCQKYNQMLAVLFIDLDRFKMVNDTMGHSIGDLLLVQAAKRLQSCIREADIVARYGGDEFIILMDDVNEEKVTDISDKIIEELSKGFVLDGNEAFTSPSIGIAIYPLDGTDEEMLVKNADTAMYLAKDKGRNNYKFYSADLNEFNSRKMLIENKLRKALENNEFFLHYQPQLNLSSGKIVGVEALLRWNNPELGLVSPLEFIPLAEENGQIITIGKWVLETACKQNKSWQDMGLAPIKIAVNISARQFQDINFMETVNEIIKRTGLDPEYLELEITESFMQNIDELNVILNKLKAKKISIAVDDFGTGYCSLSLLRTLPIDKVKIDRSFIKNFTNDPNTAALVKTIINMGHNLNFEVTAEGIEEKKQLSFLKANRCNFGQGYLFGGKPLGQDLVIEYIKNYSLKEVGSY